MTLLLLCLGAPVAVLAQQQVVVQVQLTTTAKGVLAKPQQVVFNPTSGNYLAGQQVVLTDSDTSSVIHYTTDGSMPTATSAVFAVPFVLTTSAQIRAIGVTGGLTSSVTSAYYTMTSPHLAFTTMPSTVVAGAAITPPVSVSVIDSSGGLVNTSAETITMTIGRGGGLLSGTMSAQTVNGIAQFTKQSVSLAGSAYVLTATSPHYGSASSSSFAATAPGMTVALTAASVSVGSSLLATVTLGVPAGVGGVNVAIASSSPYLLSASPTTVTIAEGQTTGTFTVQGVAVGQAVLTGSATGYTSTSVALTGTPSNVTGTTYYVSDAGLDTNDGKGLTSSWKTVAKVNGAALKTGDQVLFDPAGVWHEQLNVHVAGVRFGAYGASRSCTLSALLVATCTGMPVLDGADIVTGWAQQSGHTYKAAYRATASKGFVDSLYQQTIPLSLVESVAAVAATGGSLYSDGTYVYIHLADGSNPATHTIEISGSRTYGVYLGGYSNTTIDGLEIVRSAKSGILAYDGSTTAQNLTIQNNVLFNIGDTGKDPTPNAGTGIVERSEGGIVMQALYGQYMTGLRVQNNWVGQMDFADMVPNNTVAAIQVFSSKDALITDNKVASVHGYGLQVTDGFATTCTAPLIQNNEVANSEDNIVLLGCQNAVVVYNSVHDSAGNGIAIGGAFYSTDINNVNPYLAFNTIHDIKPGFNNGQFNGVDVNHATGGTAVGNIIYNVASSNMSLEGGSAGWILMGNIFDASGNTLFDGHPTSSTSYGLLMYLMQSGFPVTMIGNAFTYDSLTSRMDFGATNSSDSSHLYTKAQFQLVVPTAQAALSTGLFSATMTAAVSTIPSASKVTLSSAIVHLTGTAEISTINTTGTPMVGCARLYADSVWTTTTSGNVQNAMTAQSGRQYVACYDGAKWWIR